MQLAPSKNPEKESKQFAVLGLACGAIGLFVWFVGAAGLGLSIRGLILSRRIKSRQYMAMSAAGLILSLVAIVYFVATDYTK